MIATFLPCHCRIKVSSEETAVFSFPLKTDDICTAKVHWAVGRVFEIGESHSAVFLAICNHQKTSKFPSYLIERARINQQSII
jgi:hypothetical protein